MPMKMVMELSGYAKAMSLMELSGYARAMLLIPARGGQKCCPVLFSKWVGRRLEAESPEKL